MRKTLIFLIILLCPLLSKAQENSKQKEFAITMFSSFQYGMTFSFGTPGSLWRISAFNLGQQKSTTHHTSFDEVNDHFGAGVSLGKEFRRPLSDKMYLRYGVEASFTYNHQKSSSLLYESENTTYSPGINLLVGIACKLNDRISIGALLLPQIRYETGKAIVNGDESDVSAFSYGVNSSSAQVNVIFTF